MRIADIIPGYSCNVGLEGIITGQEINGASHDEYQTIGSNV
jgi:hypothetical protein